MFCIIFFLSAFVCDLKSLQVLEIPISYENFDDAEGSPECEFIPRSLPKQPDSVDTKVSKNNGQNIDYNTISSLSSPFTYSP